MAAVDHIGLRRGLLPVFMAAILTLCSGCSEPALGTATITDKGCRFWGRGAIANSRTEVTEHGWRCILEIDRRQIPKNP
jgi:hypothetical protein